MENWWYSKCESMWPPSLLASSSRVSQAQESMSLIHGTSQEHVSPDMHDLKRLCNAALGAPLLSLLSGQWAHVPCDLQHSLDPKPVPLSSQVSLNHRTADGFSAGNKVSVLSSTIWPRKDGQNMIPGEVLFPLTSSNSTMNDSNNSSVLQTANLNAQKSQPVACQNSCVKDEVKSFSSLIGNNTARPISANSWKLQNYADLKALQKVPVECNISAYHHGHNPSSIFPRVFCAGISGNLLLSGTGLLGVVCACHGLCMSISKFSEHAGSCNLDPGSTVRIDNGDTIEHWWKTIFSKSGIRVLEGRRAWDWPEGISATSGSTEHLISNMLNSSVLWNETGSFRTFEQQQYSASNSKENQSCRNIVDEYAYHKNDRTSKECSNSLFKYFVNSSHGNLSHPADKQIRGVSNPFGMNTEKASHSTTAKLDSVCRSANCLSALPNIQDLKTPFGFGARKNSNFIVERPEVSSNIELRLGQPPPQSHTLATKVIPAFDSSPNGMHAEPTKVFLSDKFVQKSHESQKRKWTLQNSDIASNPTERRGPTQLEHSSHVGEAFGAIADYKKYISNGNLKTADLNPPLLSCLKNPEPKWQFRNICDNGHDSHLNKKLHYESHGPKSEKVFFPWGSVACNIKKFHTDVSNGKNHMNTGKKLECAVNGLRAAVKSNIEFSNTFKEDLRSLSNVWAESSSGCSPAFHEKKTPLYQKSTRNADESCGRDILNNIWKISSPSDIRRFNHDLVKPIQKSVSSKETTSMGFTSKNSVFVQSATPTLSNENFCGINQGPQDESMQMPVVQSMVELTNRDINPASVKCVKGREIRMNPCIQSILTIAPSISKDQKHLLDSSRMPKMPEVGEKSMLPGTNCWMGHSNERFGTMTGSSSSTGACEPPTVEQFFVRPGGTECNFTSSKTEQCSQGLPYAYVPEKCISAAQANCLMGKYHSNGDNYCNLVKGARNGAAASLFHSKLNDNCVSLKERTKSLEKPKHSVPPNVNSVDSHPFQWRDVPKKVKESCSSTRKKGQAGSFIASLLTPAADGFKCFTGRAQTIDPLKEHEISNISSGCSDAYVRQSSIEVNKKDTSTIEGGDWRCANSVVLDEGSGNDRSWWPSNVALDNELCAEFTGSASRINLVKGGPLKVFPREPSLSFIEDNRQQNSLISEFSQYKVVRSSTVQEDCDRQQKSEIGSEKRRKTVKWMKLDAPFSVSVQSSINNECPKCTEEVVQNAHSIWDLQIPVGCDQGSPSNCEDSFELSLKQRNTAFSAAKSISLKRDLKGVYLEGEKQITETHKSFRVVDTLETSETFKKKRFRLNDASATRKRMRKICCSSAELTAKLTPFGGPSNSLVKPYFPKRMARPIVFGKYGAISNGNTSKPTNIVSLKKILKTAASRAEKGSRNVHENDKQKSMSVEVEEKSVRRMKEMALSKKVLRSQVKVGTHNLPPIEPEPRDPNEEIETGSCSATNGADDLSYTSLKCNNHGVTDNKSGVQMKKKYKEGRKRSLHELLIKGNGFKVVNSSEMKNPISLCQTTSRCWEQDAIDGRVQKNAKNNAKRCSQNHQPECQNSVKDECDQLFECTRFLIKGLRGEGEAVDNETVSFRGRCVPEGDSESLQPGENLLTCARTEGYKGRKREGFLHNFPQDANGNAGCLVPQEQLNAWMHIHRQKAQMRGRPKLSSSIVESDCRKAYARYKHIKGWKHLVVYKSGIHALGLYTSQFLSRGAMVVEYVGEIVGLRVADRRESEYHSGKKLQHKSACYFFRIDKEHIIDATRKGGIARFVNHSCQPNCVAKVISVRNEKKVVFFAERDVYPGEEITYDYHFNHEDEGEKIPCYCNSKNCRRYLN